jgi:hypothetical protein
LALGFDFRKKISLCIQGIDFHQDLLHRFGLEIERRRAMAEMIR